MKNAAIKIAVIAALIGTPALAADMAVKAPPPVSASAYSWTGFYVGGNVGYGWGGQTGNNLTITDPIGLFTGYCAAGGCQYPSVNPRGTVGGGQIGYNYQAGSVVYGVITDFQFSHMQANQTVLVPAIPIPGVGVASPENQSHSAELAWFGTLRGRIGYAFDNIMPYVSGGLAYGRVSSTLNLAVLAPGGLNMSGSNDTTRAGWTLGGGVEYGVTQHVTIGVDYIYFDLGSQTVTATPYPLGLDPGTAIAMNQHFTGNILRAVLNVKFP